MPKNDKTDCSTNKDEVNYIGEKVPKENVVHNGHDYNQIDQNENNIKQLTEIRHNKHKTYLQSKILEINKNQSNNEEHQDVYQWLKATIAISGDSIISGIKEELLSNAKHQIKVKCYRGATVEDMFDYVNPLLKWKSDYVFCTWGLITPKA